MSNGEHDYDMIWAALDHTDEGWIPSVENVNDIANGYDARYLISFGPFQLPPGTSDTISIAFFGGRDLHTDPQNYENNLRYNVEDSLSIAEYYSNLDFSDLIEKADSAFSFYSRGYTNVPPGPPRGFQVEQWSDRLVSLGWEHQERTNLLEYRIYRGTAPGVYDPEKITPDGFIDSVFADTAIVNNIIYYYAIASTAISGIQGGVSPEVFINSGQPQTPTGLTAFSEELMVDLSWDVNPDSDLYGYVVYRAVPGQEFMAIDTTESNSYVDIEVLIGREYRYRISALDMFGNESYLSDIVSIYAMAFDSGILLVMMNNRTQNPDYDSMTVFYERVLDGYPHLSIDYEPQGMPLLASFSTVWFAVDHLLGARYFDITDSDRLFSDYLDAGGNLLLTGSRQITPTRSFSGYREIQQDEFLGGYFNLAAIRFPDIYNIEFSGGRAESPSFDDFPVDTVRANRIELPPVDEDGRLPGIGTMIPNEPDETIYSYISAIPDSSDFHGISIGIIHHTDTYGAAVLEFPLYYIPETISCELLETVLAELGEVRVDVEDEGLKLPNSTSLFQNYPNPFNRETIIKFSLSQRGSTSIAVYNIIGQRVALLRDGEMEAGEYFARWNADNCPSGVYFARLTSGEIDRSVKMILLK